jgi:REP element-mobilizing transposase RayT
MHVVFSTYERQPLITQKLEPFLHKHLGHLSKEMECIPLAINGMPDHIHILLNLNPNKSISEIVKQLKGNSSHTINQSNIIPEKFAWQTGYGAFSVSESAVGKVKEYIVNQKEHHGKISFQEEYEKFLLAYKFEMNPRF